MDKFRRVQEDIDDATEMMRQNIESVVDRGEHLELLVDKSDGLATSAQRFQKSSSHLRQALWWKNVRMMLTVSGVLLIILGAAVLSYCGWGLKKCSAH